jgi:ribosomal protein S18 acetylase RimI-like enzyme
VNSFRPARDGDEPFLDALYEGTRREEVLAWGVDAAFAHTFLTDQARVQRRAYAMQYPAAEHRILLVQDAPAGRLIIDRGADWALIDISVLPALRGKGLATWALRPLLDEASAADRVVQLLVAPTNPARRLYERLGFMEVALPSGSSAAQPSPSAPALGAAPMLQMQWRRTPR